MSGMGPQSQGGQDSVAGAAVGAAGSVLGVGIQSYFHDKRERLRLVTQMALEDYKIHAQMALKSEKEVALHPLATWLHYHLGLMSLVERKKFTREAYLKLVDENTEMGSAIKEGDEFRRTKRQSER